MAFEKKQVVRNKAEFYELWEAGVLGNRTPIWRTLEEVYANKPKEVGFREAKRGGGGAWTKVPLELAGVTYQEWKRAGRTFIMDGGVPNDKSTVQGEVVRTTDGLVGFLCVREEWEFQAFGYENPHLRKYRIREPGLPPMRVTMANLMHRHTSYLETRLLIARYMDPSSQDDLDMLLEQYPDASIEFTCFSVNVGIFPRRNTLFWETRNY